MSTATSDLHLERLQQEFDGAFAAPADVDMEQKEDLLCLRAGKQLVALRCHDVGEIAKCPPLTSVPTTISTIRGVAGIRGSLVVVYDVATILGAKRRFETKRDGWVARWSTDKTVGLFFDALVGRDRVPQTDIRAADDDATTVIREIVKRQGTNLPLLNLAAAFER